MSDYRAVEATADGGFTLVEREFEPVGAGQVRVAVEGAGSATAMSPGS